MTHRIKENTPVDLLDVTEDVTRAIAIGAKIYAEVSTGNIIAVAQDSVDCYDIVGDLIADGEDVIDDIMEWF